jgi:disulfide bond formation protein DsbB
MQHKNHNLLLLFAWIVALVATAGSLFFSEVMGFPPCTMCWYQRICMYPLVLILIPAIINPSHDVVPFTLPLVVVGWLWSAYHCLLIYDVIREEMAPCSMGVPCSVEYFNWLGFIDIPTMALAAFTLIGASLILSYKGSRQ